MLVPVKSMAIKIRTCYLEWDRDRLRFSDLRAADMPCSGELRIWAVITINNGAYREREALAYEFGIIWVSFF
jgi:hypothetical protein